MSTHENNVINIVRLSKELKESPDNIFVFGVQPKDVSVGVDISLELKQVVDSLMLDLEREIKKIFNKSADPS